MMTLSSRSCAITVAVTEAPATVGDADGQVAVNAYRQHVGEGDGAAGLGVQLLHFQHRVGGDAVLFSAGADDSEHGNELSTFKQHGPRRAGESALAAGSAGYSDGGAGVNRQIGENAKAVSNLPMSPLSCVTLGHDP